MPVDHTQPIIEVNNVSFAYGPQLVLKNVSFNIHKGDYVGIIGPNGGGKTTLLKIILGLLRPTSGSVTFLDKRRLSYVSQNAVRFDTYFPATVEEVVSMGLYGKKGLFRRLDDEDIKKVHEALERVEMTSYKDRLINELSGGQQQRIFIARALVNDPEVLFLDEPTVGVDVKTQDRFYRLLQLLNTTYALTLVLVSHDVSVMVREVTEVACINQKLVYHGLPENFFKGNYSEKLNSSELSFFHSH